MRKQEVRRAKPKILRIFQQLLRENLNPFESPLLYRACEEKGFCGYKQPEALICTLSDFCKQEGEELSPRDWRNSIICKDEIGNYYTLLLAAAKYNEDYAVKYFVEKQGIDVNPPKIPCTALYYAANNNNLKMVQLLVNKYQAKINAGSNIHFANEITQFDDEWDGEDQYELDSRFNDSDSDDDFWWKKTIKPMTKMKITHWKNITPLHEAAEHNNLEMVKFLVNAGAKVNMRALFKEEVRKGSEYYEEWTKVGGVSSLHYAVSNNNLDMVEVLLNAGADVNKVSYDTTPLHVAARHNNLAIVKCLVNAKADVSACIRVRTNEYDEYRDEWDYEVSVLYYAIQNNNLEMVKYLVSAGAEVNTWSMGKSLYDSASDLEMRNFLQFYVVTYRSLTTQEVSYEEFVYKPAKDNSAEEKDPFNWERTSALSFLQLDETENGSLSNEEITAKVAVMNKEKRISQWKQFSIFDLQMSAHPKIGEELPERPRLILATIGGLFYI